MIGEGERGHLALFLWMLLKLKILKKVKTFTPDNGERTAVMNRGYHLVTGVECTVQSNTNTAAPKTR